MKKVLVTGSAGHLGEALAWTLTKRNIGCIGIDIKPSTFTTIEASINDRESVCHAMRRVDTVFHAATLHKPHIITHSKQDFIDTNITGTEILLEAAIESKVQRFIFTSTTSTYGHAMSAPKGKPAIWVNENLVPLVKNIYGASKLAAENLCRLAHKESGLNCLILRTSRFFPEEDDSAIVRSGFSADNSKANEFLNRRAELSDIVESHLCAARRAEDIGFGLYIISATSPFNRYDLNELNQDAMKVVKRYFPYYEEIYGRLGWSMTGRLDRVYDNSKAQQELGWQPHYSFETVLDGLRKTGTLPRSDVTSFVGTKGYHEKTFSNGPFPV
ncbi:MAG: NAD(P)-dependent oxidoreductase [Gammaproteobacteria bacterium]|nr:NAD(P)-dependent oxidoreductase [Gammaproteobacteria bacterium]